MLRRRLQPFGLSTTRRRFPATRIRHDGEQLYCRIGSSSIQGVETVAEEETYVWVSTVSSKGCTLSLRMRFVGRRQWERTLTAPEHSLTVF